ncbi:hypothetical protein, partial [Escherichia coli]|uniref:hypothetical protein n=1 Tax=Escherichia coli TaxID=562 RepID=UPI000E2D7AAF
TELLERSSGTFEPLAFLPEKSAPKRHHESLWQVVSGGSQNCVQVDCYQNRITGKVFRDFRAPGVFA